MNFGARALPDYLECFFLGTGVFCHLKFKCYDSFHLTCELLSTSKMKNFFRNLLGGLSMLLLH